MAYLKKDSLHSERRSPRHRQQEAAAIRWPL